MAEKSKRDRKKAELSLLKLLFPEIFGEHEIYVRCMDFKGAQDATYPLSQLTKVGQDYYCSEHLPLSFPC